jgi:kynurenine formamidase
MYAEGAVVADIPIETLMGKAVLMDFSDMKPGDEIKKEQLEDWIRKHGDVKGMIVFLFTGMQSLVGESIFIENWIGLTAESAEFLVSKGIKVIGTDACNIDCVSGREKDFPAHHTFLRHGISNVENLCNLEKLPTYGFYAIIAPMKLKKSSGAPARVIALV